MCNKAPCRTRFITGVSSGMGYALTSAAAISLGNNVFALDRYPEPLKEIAETHPERLLAVQADIRDKSEIEAAATWRTEKFGRIDVAVNRAGYGLWGAVEEADDAHVRAAFETNVFGTFNFLRAILPALSRPTLRSYRHTAFHGQSVSTGMGLIASVNYAKEGLREVSTNPSACT